MHPILIGSAKSRTMWFAAGLFVISNLQPLWPQIGAAIHCAPASIELIGSVIGIIVAGLRMVTSDSLSEKGAAPAVPTPPAIP